MASHATAAAQSDSSSIVRAIEIRRIGVFDSAEASNWIFRLANHLHRGTRESVIRPELHFHEGRPYDSAATAESARNLRALGLFRDVEVLTTRTDSGLVERLTTRDAWSTSVGVDVESTGQQVFYDAEFIETNFLGTGSRLVAKYGKYSDYNAVDLEFAHPRLIDNRIGFDVYHQERSDGKQSSLLLDDPFRALASPVGVSLLLKEFDGRVLQFRDGGPVAFDTLQNRTGQILLQAARAIHGDAGGYVRLGVIAQVLRNDYTQQSSTAPFPNHTIFSAGVSLAVSRAHFKTTSNYEHLQQIEDVDLSTTVTIGALLATKAGGNPDNGIAPFANFRVGKEIPDGFGILAGLASGTFSAGGLDSGSVAVAGTGTFRLLEDPPATAGARMEGGMARNVAPIDQYDLGAGFGPRGFEAHAFTGDRYFFTTAEYRITVTPELGHVAGLALGAFADYGGAWFAGSAPRSGTDVGVGVRIGPTRQADLRTMRIDLVRRFRQRCRRGRVG